MMTKKSLLAALLLLPLPAFAGWEYYVLDDQGQWEQVSPRELNLAVPETGGDANRDDRRVMIIYNSTRDKEKSPRYRNWIPQVSSDLAETVE